MTEQYTFRQYCNDDFEQVVRLHFEGLVQMGIDIDTSRWDTAKDGLTGLDEDLNDIEGNYLINGDFLIAVSEQSAIGMGAIRKYDDSTAEVRRMRIYKEYQGKGIGSRMLDELTRRAISLGYSRLVLDTLENNHRARKFYEKHGFRLFDKGVFGGQNIVFYENSIQTSP